MSKPDRTDAPVSRSSARPDRARRTVLLALLIASTALARAGMLDSLPAAGTEGTHFLPAGEAFRVDWIWNEDGAAVGTFRIAPGYYLYRDRIRVTLIQPAGGHLAALELPPGDVKEDPYAGRQQVYHGAVEARQPIALPSGGAGPLEIEAVWQGCAEAGLCYPPVRRRFMLHP